MQEWAVKVSSWSPPIVEEGSWAIVGMEPTYLPSMMLFYLGSLDANSMLARGSIRDSEMVHSGFAHWSPKKAQITPHPNGQFKEFFGCQ